MAAAAEVGEFTLLTCSTPAIAEAYLVSFGSDVGRAADAYFEDQARGSVPDAPAPVPGAHFTQNAHAAPHAAPPAPPAPDRVVGGDHSSPQERAPTQHWAHDASPPSAPLPLAAPSPPNSDSLAAMGAHPAISSTPHVASAEPTAPPAAVASASSPAVDASAVSARLLAIVNSTAGGDAHHQDVRLSPADVAEIAKAETIMAAMDSPRTPLGRRTIAGQPTLDQWCRPSQSQRGGGGASVSASASKREREVIAISDSSDDDDAAAPRPSAVPARASALAPRPADRRGQQAAPPLRQDPQAATPRAAASTRSSQAASQTTSLRQSLALGSNGGAASRPAAASGAPSPPKPAPKSTSHAAAPAAAVAPSQSTLPVERARDPVSAAGLKPTIHQGSVAPAPTAALHSSSHKDKKEKPKTVTADGSTGKEKPKLLLDEEPDAAAPGPAKTTADDGVQDVAEVKAGRRVRKGALVGVSVRGLFLPARVLGIQYPYGSTNTVIRAQSDNSRRVTGNADATINVRIYGLQTEMSVMIDDLRYPFLLCTAALASYSDEIIGAVHCMLGDGFVYESEIEFCQNHHLDLTTGEPMPCPCDLPPAAQHRTYLSPPQPNTPAADGEVNVVEEKENDKGDPNAAVYQEGASSSVDEDAAAPGTRPAPSGCDDQPRTRPLSNARVYSTAQSDTLRAAKPAEMERDPAWRVIPPAPPMELSLQLQRSPDEPAQVIPARDLSLRQRIEKVEMRTRSWTSAVDQRLVSPDPTVDCIAPIHAHLPCLTDVRSFLPWLQDPTKSKSDTAVDNLTAESLRVALAGASSVLLSHTKTAGAVAAMLYVHCRNVRSSCTPCPEMARMVAAYFEAIECASDALYALVKNSGDKVARRMCGFVGPADSSSDDEDAEAEEAEEGEGEGEEDDGDGDGATKVGSGESDEAVGAAEDVSVTAGGSINDGDEDAPPRFNGNSGSHSPADEAIDGNSDEDDEERSRVHNLLIKMTKCMQATGFALLQPTADCLSECSCTDGVAFFNLVNSSSAEVRLSSTAGLWEHEETGAVFANARCKLAFRDNNENKPYRCARALEAYHAMVHFQSKSIANGDDHDLHDLDVVNRHTRWITSPCSPTFKGVAPPTQDDERLALLATQCNAGLAMSPDRVRSLRATLSGHQRETLQWMMDREDHPWYMAKIRTRQGVESVSSINGLRLKPALAIDKPQCFGIVADEMGLGKTITTLALIAARPASAEWLRTRRHIKATLVVVPVSIGVQWEREAKQFLPNHTFHMIHGTYSKQQTPVHEADIVVVTYETLASRLRKDTIEVSYHFHRVIFDEVQQGWSKSVLGLKAGRRWALSGTPPTDEFTFHYVVNDMLCVERSRDADMLSWPSAAYGSKTRDPAPFNFTETPRIDGGLRTFYPALLKAEQRRAFVMRHVKSDPAVVASLDLPPRRTNVVRVVLPGPERRAYAAVEEQTRRDVRGIRRADGRLGVEHVHRLIGWVDRLRRVATEAELARVQGVFHRQAQFEQRAGQVAQQTSIVPAAEAEAALRRDGFKMPEALLEILRALAGDPPEFDECAVCLDGYQRPVVLRCGHVFCHECVTSLSNARGPQNAAQAGRCPLCKDLTLDGKKAEIATPSAVDTAAALAAANAGADGGGAPDAAAAAAAAEDEAGTPGGKVGAAVRLIASLLEEQGSAKVLVFSVYPQFLSQVHEQLSRRRVRCFEVNGATTMKKRGELIKAFQDPRDASRVCLLSSRAGDAGLTLTAANHVVLLEPSLNAAVDAQAIGRVHRFGQRREVTVHRVVVKGTVEERVQALLDQGRLVTTERTIGSAAQAHYTAEAAGQLADIIAQDAL